MADREKKPGKKGEGSRGRRGGGAPKQGGGRGTGPTERTESERGPEAQERGISGEYGSEERDLGKRRGEKGGDGGGRERPRGETPPSP